MEKNALEAEKKARKIIIKVVEIPTNRVFFKTGTIANKSSAFNPNKTLFVKIITGTIKPKDIGTKQNAIANIAIGRGNKEKVSDSGALIPLIELTSSANSNVQRQAARALFALTGSERNQREIVKHNGLVPLLTLLSSSKVEVRKHAAGAVANIATNKDIKPDIIQCGALEPLLDATKSLSSATCSAVRRPCLTSNPREFTGALVIIIMATLV